MDILSEFFKEQASCETLITEHGFVAYCFTADSIFCNQFYVHPDHRKSGESKRIVSELNSIAIKNGVDKIIVTVQHNHEKSHGAIMAIVLSGFVFKGLNTIQNLVFEKKVENV